MHGTVVIDCFPDSVKKYRDHAIVGVDVIRATTTAVTAVAMGRRCFLAPTLEGVVELAQRLKNPLVVGELGGNMPYGFDMTNSPAELMTREDVERPMILISTSGTPVVSESAQCVAGYAACLRNVTAQVSHLAGRYNKVAAIGAGSRGEFREEDQFCCAKIAEGLIGEGYQAADEQTREIIERWRGAPPDAFVGSKSVEYLRRSGQLKDLDFILEHRDDLNAAFRFQNDELEMIPVEALVKRR
jgi:2-phosphosulfolactate phosphatase